MTAPSAAYVRIGPFEERRMRIRKRHSVRVGVLILLGWSAIAAQSRTPPVAAPSDVDGWVARAMQTFEVPGLALAIVKDDVVVLAKGYGVRKLGEPTPVDSHTRFGIASNTKAFTA